MIRAQPEVDDGPLARVIRWHGHQHLKVYVATRSIGFRKGHDGVAAAVQEMIVQDLFNGGVFVFRSKTCR